MGKYPRPVDAPPEEWIPTRVEHPTGRPNFCIVYTPHAWLAYSYETLVGVRPIVNDSIGEWIVRENEWGPTTGKHLKYLEANQPNWVRKTERLPTEKFKVVAESVLHNDRAYLHSLARQALEELGGLDE